ncbi:ATP-binding protein [Modestobacter lapidis]
MTTLFNAADVAEAVRSGSAGRARVGHRLHRLELLNWGTFDQRVWTFTPGGDDSLLTGDIGSGKSTVVDALTTLLVPPQRITFNRAAGAETRERDLRSYVLGHYKAERSETTGGSAPVGLRRGPTFTVLLAVFANEGYGTTTSLAVVLWLADGQTGQPDRFYVTADRELTIAGDLTSFGGDPAALRKRLTASGTGVHDGYPAYAQRLRRLLDIPSAQAIELFAQTVSMKAVGDLTGFVRQHMLEPFDAQTWVDKLVTHFESLTRAHDAVVAARTQLEQLDPLLAAAVGYETLSERIAALAAQRAALPAFAADRTVALLETESRAAAERLAALTEEKQRLDDDIARDGEEVKALEREMDGQGGARLREIDLRVELLTPQKAQRRARASAYTVDLGVLGLPPVETAEAFAARRPQIAELHAEQESRRAGHREQADRLAVHAASLKAEEAELNAELLELRRRRVNIPAASLDLRARLLTATGLSEGELPFAGELIQVRPEHADWEGAAERVLRGLGLSLLVPDRHYAAVSDWVEHEHLRGRLVYYRVPARPEPARPPRSPHPLADVVEVKEGPLASWLRGEVLARADLERVETTAQFRRSERAVTRAGQVKGGRNRHEKDDRFRIDDRRNYVLGWSPEAKIDALLEGAGDLGRRRKELGARGEELRSDEQQLRSRGAALDRVAGVTGFEELDWAGVVRQIEELTAERDRLTGASGELTRLQGLLVDAARRVTRAQHQRDQVLSRAGSTESERRRALAEADVRRQRAATARDVHPAVLDALHGAAPVPAPTGVTGWDDWEKTTLARLTDEHDRATVRRSQAAGRVTSAMHDFRLRWPLLTGELDDAVESISGYRELHGRLVSDDLPRFEAEFQDLLRTNAIRDIAMFSAELRKQSELIGERIDRINDSLRGIDYNPGRYISLETARTPNMEVRTFLADLRACTDDALDGGDADGAYSERKFHQVRALVERFRGCDGSTEADRIWTQRVTDVRNWVVFTAVERWRDTDEEHETYTDSGGKSGGQKEKLAYTVLAASLAYQFKLSWGADRAKAFQMAVIDEAFGRGSDESTRYALALFRRLGLQLIVVTPLQKIHVIEHAVSAVGFVDNPTGAGSRMHTLTIQEYRAGRAAHLAADQPAPDSAPGD